MAEDWTIIDDLLGGTREMREKTVAYLPKQPKELDVLYRNRLSMSFLKPALRNAIFNARGAVFRFEIDISGVNPRLKPLMEDVDLLGNDITSFLNGALGDMLTYGHCHLLAAFPTMAQGATLADVQAIGARPYGVRLDPRNVISWRRKPDDSLEVLEQVRFREIVPAPTSDWDTDTTETRVRVLKIGEWEEWAKPTAAAGTSASSEWVLIASGQISLDDIPWTTIYADKVDFMVSRPPFLDLAWLNLAHWQSYSDYRHILHVVQVPLLFGTGMKAEGESIVIGATSAVLAEDTNAKLSWVEHAGNAIASGRQELLDLEAAMENLGSALMSEEQPGDQTATAKSIDTAKEQAGLGGIVRGLEDGTNQFLWQMGRWIGLEDAGEITIRRPAPLGGTQNVAGDQQQQTSGGQDTPVAQAAE